MNIIKKMKYKNKIVCYIVKSESGLSYATCTGKPSDINCFMWISNTIEEATKKANEYLNNYINLLKSC